MWIKEEEEKSSSEEFSCFGKIMIDMDLAQKMRRCHEYVEALEEEQRKIQVFERELPLCLELVTQGLPLFVLFPLLSISFPVLSFFYFFFLLVLKYVNFFFFV